MRILLTGIQGQVGWELRRTLAPLGEIHGFDRSGLDLTDPDAIRRVVRGVAPTLIVNAAAYTAVDKAEAEPDLATAINATAPGVLAEEARRVGAAVVHYSTDYVFDGEKEGPYVEDDAPRPLGVYGRSKLAGEDAVRASGAPHLILRTSWVYGARGRNFMLTMLRLARERDELRVVDDQFGAPTWCRMIAEATALVVARCRPGSRDLELSKVSGLYHLSAAGRTSWHGFATAILEDAAALSFGRLRARRVAAIVAADYPTPAARPRNSRLSNVKLQRVFGIVLPEWEDSLSRCLEEMGQTNGSGAR
jgi:dTDP-4-dehydrorhamnose reductase